MAQVELKFLFTNLDEYNAFCAANGVTVDAGALPPVTAEPTLVEYDPVADGSVEAETPALAPAAPASGKKRGRPAKAVAPAAEETPPAEPAPGKTLLITCVGCLHQDQLPETEPCGTCNGGRNWTAKTAPSEPAADASPATLDDAMAAGGRLVEACGNSNVEALAILKSMGFSRVSAMETPEQFAEFIRRCDEAVAAKGAGAGGIL